MAITPTTVSPVSLVDWTTRQLLHATQDTKNEAFLQAIQASKDPVNTASAVKKLLRKITREGRGDHYAFAISLLRQLYPEINDYVIQVTGPAGPIDVLSSNSLKMIIEQLLGHKKLKFPCFLCENYDELEEEIRKLSHSPDGRFAFIARNQQRGATPPVRHVSPVFIEKKGGQYTCVVTDSMGGDNFFGDLIASKLSKMFAKWTPEYKIFTYRGKARQLSPTNCPLFCLMDALYFSRKENFPTFCEKQSRGCEEKIANTRIAYFNTLPKKMLKISQNHPELAFSKKNFIEKKFLKYERDFIAQVILAHFATKP